MSESSSPPGDVAPSSTLGSRDPAAGPEAETPGPSGGSGAAEGEAPADDGDDDDEDGVAVPSSRNRLATLFDDDEEEDVLAPRRRNGDADEGDDDGDDDEVRPSGRARPRAPSSAASDDADAPSSQARGAGTRDDLRREASAGAASETSLDARRRRELELLEDPEDEPMGAGPSRTDGGRRDADVAVARFSLPSQPLRRGAQHWFSRLPNFMQYRAEAFDEATFDEKAEDQALSARGDIHIADAGLRSLLTTTNTIRWRWSNKRDAQGRRIPESNARFVRWSDGTMSLQLGQEMYDVTETVERRPASSVNGPKASVPSMHLFVNHATERVMHAEGALAGTLGMRPTNLQSETHRRLARAVKQQRTQRVQQAVLQRGARDPALEKEDKEKQLRQESLRRERRLRKEREARDARTGDEQLLSSMPRRGGAASAARSGAANGGVGPAGGSQRDRVGSEGISDGEGDGFVVASDEDAEGEAEDEDADDMDEDEMEAAERRIEEERAARKKDRANAAAAAASTPGDMGVAAEGGGDRGGGDEADAPAARRKRAVFSDEEDDD